MDMIDSLLGGRGCSVDGTVTRNPITAMVDRVFETHVAPINENQQLFGEEHGLFIDGFAQRAPPAVPSMGVENKATQVFRLICT